MKKNIKKAHMGGSYASRRAYKSAGATKPSASSSKKSEDSKSKLGEAPEGLINRVDGEGYNSNIVERKKSYSVKGRDRWQVKYLGPSGKNYVEDAIKTYGSAPRVGSVKNNNQSISSSPAPAKAKTEEKKTGGGGGGERRRAASTVSKAATPSPVVRTEKITPKKKLAPIPLGLPERKRPTVAREYSKTERNINQQIEKIKKGEGSTEAAQMKIKALKEKEKAQQVKSQRQEKRSNNKALRKSVRAGKFNARQVKKSAK